MEMTNYHREIISIKFHEKIYSFALELVHIEWNWTEKVMKKS